MVHEFKNIKILLIFITVLYISFMYIDIFHIHSPIFSDGLKFLSMILVFIISFLIRKKSLDFKDFYLLQIGLFITLIADLFLLVLNNYYILGVFLFSIVQILYSFRYESGNIKFTVKNLSIVFLSLCITYIIIDNLIRKMDFIWIMGAFYGICIFNSFIKSVRAYKYKRYPRINSIMILIGMIFFLLCDINVFIYNIFNEGLLYNISSILIWLFYLPSQILLVLSGYNYELLRNL